MKKLFNIWLPLAPSGNKKYLINSKTKKIGIASKANPIIGIFVLNTKVSTKAPNNKNNNAKPNKYKLKLKTSMNLSEANSSRSTSFDIILPDMAARK